MNTTLNEKSGFVSAIVKTFDGFVKVFKKHGLLTVTFIMVLFLLFYSFILHPVNINQIVTDALKKENEIRIEQQQKSIEQRIAADKMMNELMNDIVDNFNVNRCLLFEIHNGTSSLTNLEYLFYSATNELINTNNTQGEDVYNLEYQADSFQKQHIANFIGQVVYNRLKHEKYLYFSNLESYHRTSYRFINKLKDIGAESVMIIPFVSNNIPMVLLVLTSKDTEMDCSRIYDYVEKFRPIIEKNLINI